MGLAAFNRSRRERAVKKKQMDESEILRSQKPRKFNKPRKAKENKSPIEEAESKSE